MGLRSKEIQNSHLTSPSGRSPLKFVTDFQARPHLIVVCPGLDSAGFRRLELQPRNKKPSFWDLPNGMQAEMLYIMLEAALRHEAKQCEIHLGEWVDTAKLHAHLVLDSGIYISEFLKHVTPEEYRKAHNSYLQTTESNRFDYHQEDEQAVRRNLVAPVRAIGEDGARVSFDSTQSTSVMTVSFDKGLCAMSMAEVQEVTACLQRVACQLGLRSASYILPTGPALEEAALRSVRVLVPPEVFVTCLPVEERDAWLTRWVEGDPVARATGEDMAPIPLCAGARSTA